MKETIFITVLFLICFAFMGVTMLSIKASINKCSQEYYVRDCLGI